jgi:hypothetical protein
MLQMNPKLIGQYFYPNIDPTTKWTCQGFADTGTLVIIGSTWDQASNRSRLNTFKIVDVKFEGAI